MLEAVAYKNPLDPRNRAARLRHYYSNKEQYKAANKARKLRNVQIVREAKLKACIDCNRQYPYYVMDFDHVTGEKKGNVAHLVCGGTNVLIQEIKKCEVVCANCHRERTFKCQRGVMAASGPPKPVGLGSNPGAGAN